jgi:hypothetical protein
MDGPPDLDPIDLPFPRADEERAAQGLPQLFVDELLELSRIGRDRLLVTYFAKGNRARGYTCLGKTVRKDFAERFIKFGYVLEEDQGLLPGCPQSYISTAKALMRRARGRDPP